jgi:hypothetical protein
MVGREIPQASQALLLQFVVLYVHKGRITLVVCRCDSCVVFTKAETSAI